MNNRIGVPPTLLALGPEHGAAVVEAGISMPGEVKHLASMIAPTVRVVLNAGLAHVEFLKDAAGVSREKAILFDGARPDDVLVYSADDPLVSAEALRRAIGQRLSLGFSSQAHVRAVDLRSRGADGSTFQLLTTTGEAEVQLRLPGNHGVWIGRIKALPSPARSYFRSREGDGSGSSRTLTGRRTARGRSGTRSTGESQAGCFNGHVSVARDSRDWLAGSARATPACRSTA